MVFSDSLSNCFTYKNPMEVLDIVIRNLLTLFGVHSFQSPVALGVFVPLDMAKKTTLITLSSHMLLLRFWA